MQEAGRRSKIASTISLRLIPSPAEAMLLFEAVLTMDTRIGGSYTIDPVPSQYYTTRPVLPGKKTYMAKFTCRDVGVKTGREIRYTWCMQMHPRLDIESHPLAACG